MSTFENSSIARLDGKGRNICNYFRTSLKDYEEGSNGARYPLKNEAGVESRSQTDFSDYTIGIIQYNMYCKLQ